MTRVQRLAALLLLAVARAGGTPRELVGWTAPGRNARDASGFTAGACAGAGEIAGTSQHDSLTGCEFSCAKTPGCVWYAYCAARMDPALPANHNPSLCNDQVGMLQLKSLALNHNPCTLNPEP